MPHLYSLTILLFCWPLKEQVQEERVESSDLCLQLKSATSSFNPLDITTNATRSILSTSRLSTVSLHILLFLIFQKVSKCCQPFLTLFLSFPNAKCLRTSRVTPLSPSPDSSAGSSWCQPSETSSLTFLPDKLQFLAMVIFFRIINFGRMTPSAPKKYL